MIKLKSNSIECLTVRHVTLQWHHDSETATISKVAEPYICSFFNSHFNSFIDINQFGCTNSRSTVHALIKLSGVFFSSSDNSAKIIHVLFIDFSEAFDVLDHNVLLQKFLDYDFPPHIIAWSMSFLHERSQYVLIRNRNSCCRVLHAGTHQGTLSGPNDFKLLINDLSFNIAVLLLHSHSILNEFKSDVCVLFFLIYPILMHYSYLDLNALLRDEKGLFVILLRIFNSLVILYIIYCRLDLTCNLI
jgi:hypothetical protein